MISGASCKMSIPAESPAIRKITQKRFPHRRNHRCRGRNQVHGTTQYLRTLHPADSSCLPAWLTPHWKMRRALFPANRAFSLHPLRRDASLFEIAAVWVSRLHRIPWPLRPLWSVPVGPDPRPPATQRLTGYCELTEGQAPGRNLSAVRCPLYAVRYPLCLPHMHLGPY